MNIISEQDIEHALEEFEQMPESEIDQEIELFTKQQEVLFAYVMTIDEDLGSDERQAMLMIAIQVWAILKKYMPDIKPVSADLLDQIDQDNEQLLEQFSQEGDDETTNIERLLAQHEQPYLLDLTLAYLYEDVEENNLPKENSGYIFIYLLNFLDALLASVAK